LIRAKHSSPCWKIVQCRAPAWGCGTGWGCGRTCGSGLGSGRICAGGLQDVNPAELALTTVITNGAAKLRRGVRMGGA
jgi:hypothetical protein